MRYSASFLFAAALASSGCDRTAQSTQESSSGEAPLATQVLGAADAELDAQEWGEASFYFSGETQGVQNLLSGTATLKPGYEAHPPHRHAEEEFLIVVAGEGEWTLGDKKFPAKTGDMLYSEAWVLHGIENTGDDPLTFVFWKWNSKGIPVPADPAE